MLYIYRNDKAVVSMNKWRDQAFNDEPIALKIVVGECSRYNEIRLTLLKHN